MNAQWVWHQRDDGLGCIRDLHMYLCAAHGWCDRVVIEVNPKQSNYTKDGGSSMVVWKFGHQVGAKVILVTTYYFEFSS